MVDDKIIKRLQALLALAEGRGATEAEAALAMERAQDLLAKHNLSMASVFAAGAKDTEKREESELAAIKGSKGRAAMYKWQQELMRSIADANYCRHWIRTTYNAYNGHSKLNSHVLIGRESNVVACRLMFEYLLQSMDRMIPVNDKSRSAYSWKEGCVDRLRERIEQQRWDREEANRKEAAEAELRAKEAQAQAKHPASAPSPLGTSHAPTVILADYAQEEEDLNADVRRGVEPGTTAREKREREARRLAVANEPYVWTPPPPDTRTEAQKAKDRRREEKADERMRARWRREAAREAARRDVSAYRAGTEAGNKIGLDLQLGDGKGRKLR